MGVNNYIQVSPVHAGTQVGFNGAAPFAVPHSQMWNCYTYSDTNLSDSEITHRGGIDYELSPLTYETGGACSSTN